MSTRAPFFSRDDGILCHCDYGAGSVFKRVDGLRERGDDRFLAGEAAGEFYRRHYLRLHASGTELPLFHVLDRLGYGDVRKCLLIGLAKVDIDVLDFGEDEKDVRFHVLRESLRREIFVYDRRDA